MPKAEQACFDKPEWGSNPNEVNDRDFAAANVFKVVWSGMKDKWPAAYEILKAVSIDTTAQQNMMAAVDQKGQKLSEEIASWMNANAATVDGWIAAGK